MVTNVFRLLFAAVLILSWSNLRAEEISFVGLWKTIDDKTGKEKSLVQVWEDEKGNLRGKIIKLFRAPDEEQNPLCDKCEGDNKNAPIIGMEILSEFTPDNKKSESTWSSGKILDPKTGVTYSCNLNMDEAGVQMKVRGYVGFSLIGRTQTWVRQIDATDASDLEEEK